MTTHPSHFTQSYTRATQRPHPQKLITIPNLYTPPASDGGFSPPETEPTCKPLPTPCRLLRSQANKTSFVDSLVDAASIIIRSIWPSSEMSTNQSQISTTLFVQETLRRSRTSFSTMQLSLYYCIKLHHSQKQLKKQASPISSQLSCGRRMFLASLILASKYLQDKNYSNKAWSKISGLPVGEINSNELEFLKCIGWNMYLAPESFCAWNGILHDLIAEIRQATYFGTCASEESTWASMVQEINPNHLTGKQLPTPVGTPTFEVAEKKWPVCEGFEEFVNLSPAETPRKVGLCCKRSRLSDDSEDVKKRRII